MHTHTQPHRACIVIPGCFAIFRDCGRTLLRAFCCADVHCAKHLITTLRRCPAVSRRLTSQFHTFRFSFRFLFREKIDGISTRIRVRCLTCACAPCVFTTSFAFVSLSLSQPRRIIARARARAGSMPPGVHASRSAFARAA